MHYTIILAAKNLETSSSYSSQMMPIRGKPALSWVIEDFLEDKVIVVLDKNNVQMQCYLNKRYPDVELVLVDPDEEMEKYNSFSIVNSLNRGLSAIKGKCSLIKVALGDTLCRYVPKKETDLILVSDDFISSERWCLVETDTKNFAREFFDKIPNLEIENKLALVGYYQFSDFALLQKIVKQELKNLKKQISAILTQYMQHRPIECEKTPTWFDLGHKAGVIKAQNHFFNSRDFNSLYADPIKGTITKVSPKRQKLADEYAWYINLPEELKVLAPRPISFKENIDSAQLCNELYGYPALSELFILGDLDIEEWEMIITRLFEVHRLFEAYTAKMDIENFYDLYLHKTWARLKDLQEQNPYWKKLWDYDEIIINGKTFKNIKHFQHHLNEAIEKLVKNVKISVMHGDYCFSNILFDTHCFISKVIDPRGRLKEQTIYGDARYDIAKLRHSVVGGYDFAVHGLFTLIENKNMFEVKNAYPSFQARLTEFFDKMTIQFGFNLNEIKLIEALLFTSMIPLHKDCLKRQKIFYLKAVKKINALFGEKKNA